MLVILLALFMLVSCKQKNVEPPKVRQEEIYKHDDPEVEREIAKKSSPQLNRGDEVDISFND